MHERNAAIVNSQMRELDFALKVQDRLSNVQYRVTGADQTAVIDALDLIGNTNRNLSAALLRRLISLGEVQPTTVVALAKEALER